MEDDNNEEFLARVRGNRIGRMSKIDAMDPEIRRCVHEYGFTVVDLFLQQKITKPRVIRHIVERILDEFSPTRGSYAAQGERTGLARIIDDQTIKPA